MQFNQTFANQNVCLSAKTYPNCRDFYHVNDYFGDLQSPSVRDADLSLAQDLVSRSYGARLNQEHA